MLTRMPIKEVFFFRTKTTLYLRYLRHPLHRSTSIDMRKLNLKKFVFKPNRCTNVLWVFRNQIKKEKARFFQIGPTIFFFFKRKLKFGFPSSLILWMACHRQLCLDIRQNPICLNSLASSVKG